ncbi:binding partner of ACD11 1-like isoform X1 [Carex rostrata]
MAVPLEQNHLSMAADPQVPVTSSWTIDVSDVRTVKVSNISLQASERDIKEFFSFSGSIEYVEMRGESERSQVAYVTFKDSQGADTAALLTGATIIDLSVTITPVENYQLPPEAYRQLMSKQKASATEPSAVLKAEDVVSGMLAKGYVLSKDALNVAKSFDERHRLLLNASATVASLDRQIGLSDKISAGTALVSGKMREVDERYQVSELTRSAIAVAEQKATSAGSALMNNRYVSTGASWFTSALGMVAKAAGDVTSLTKEKVEKVEEERKDNIWKERNGMVSEYAQMHFDELPTSWEPATVAVESDDEQRVQIF